MLGLYHAFLLLSFSHLFLVASESWEAIAVGFLKRGVCMVV